MAFYAYKVKKEILIVTKDVNKVEADGCETFETLEDIPFGEYDYYAVDDGIPTELIKNRIRD